MQKRQTGWIREAVGMLCCICIANVAGAATIEFNNTGGSTSTNGLHIYIEDTTKIQVRRLNNTGQVYQATATPPNNSLDNGIFDLGDNTFHSFSPQHPITHKMPVKYDWLTFAS